MENPKKRLDAAISLLLKAKIDVPVSSELEQQNAAPESLFELRYDQTRASTSNLVSGNTCAFPPPSLDLAFDDSTLDNVEEAYLHVLGKVGGDQAQETPYMVFKSREQFDDDDE